MRERDVVLCIADESTTPLTVKAVARVWPVLPENHIRTYL